MGIPDYQAFMHPLLEAVSNGAEHHIRDVTKQLADQFALTLDERCELLPSGAQTIVGNRVGWARTYLKKAGLIESPLRGRIQITQAGRDALAAHPLQIDNRFLERYPSFAEFIEKQPISTERSIEQKTTATPEELLESSYTTLRGALSDELLERVRACSPQFFERLVVELLVAMGYGGSRADAGRAIGRSGDAGIDGIIKEDRLGLDVVCIQAKRWQGTVGRPEVQAFAGSMEGARATKGVLITTSTFSSDADKYVHRIEKRIVLIDGEQLTQFMIDHEIGVAVSQTYVVRKVDLDYFVEDKE